MRCRFLHIADLHLGNRQYGLLERADDFADAFYQVLDHAMTKRVDFVLVAGDLFHKQQLDAHTLTQAMVGLEKLQRANIPCVVVEGNHEAGTWDNWFSWLNFLAGRKLILLLRPELGGEAGLTPKPWAAGQGAFIDLPPGVRIYGLHYVGSATKTLLGKYASAIAALPHEQSAEAAGSEYRIFMAHTGVQGMTAQDGLSPSRPDWEPLREHVDYVALGHVHKPFDIEDWIFNPGSLETCSIDETAWTERGALLVTVDTVSRGHRVDLFKPTRRPFQRLQLKVDRYATAEALLAACADLLAREGWAHSEGTAERLRPVVELTLTGRLAFPHQTLELDAVRTLVARKLNALHVIVNNLALPLEAAVRDLGAEMSRDQIERGVFHDLFEADPRYSAQAEFWASGALEIKRLAMQDAPASLIATQIEALLDAEAARPDSPPDTRADSPSPTAAP